MSNNRISFRILLVLILIGFGGLFGILSLNRNDDYLTKQCKESLEVDYQQYIKLETVESLLHQHEMVMQSYLFTTLEELDAQKLQQTRTDLRSQALELQSEIESTLESFENTLMDTQLEEKYLSVNSKISNYFTNFDIMLSLCESQDHAAAEEYCQLTLEQNLSDITEDISEWEKEISDNISNTADVINERAPQSKIYVYMDIAFLGITLLFGIWFAIKNIHQLQQLAEELKHEKQSADKANQDKSVFLGNMSHDVRTPIYTILGFDDKIIQESKDSTLIEYSLRIQAAAKTLLSMFNDIMDYAQLEEDNLKIEQNDYSIQGMIQDMAFYAKSGTEQKDLSLELKIDEKLPLKLNGDVVRIAQICSNLLTNAIKYTSDGGVKIYFGWQEGTDDIHGNFVFQIADTGNGFKETEVALISKCASANTNAGSENIQTANLLNKNSLKYSEQKTDEYESKEIERIGLGLTIVTRLLRLMKGDLKLESVYGKGSEFTILIPQTRVSNETVNDWNPLADYESILKEEQVSLRVRGVKILIADDNKMNLDILYRLFRGTGAVIEEAENGREAIGILEKKDDFDLIIMDHMMPVLDGVQTLQEIKKRGLASKAKIIVFTANAVDGAREEYLSMGFDDLITKPIRNEELVRIVKKHIAPDKLVKTSQEPENSSVYAAKAGTFASEENKLQKEDGSSAGNGSGSLSGASEQAKGYEEKSQGSRESDSPADIRKRLEELEQLDTELGLSYCGDDEEFYIEMLQTYLEGANYDEIEGLYQGEQWKDYQIKVHALKSTSLSIGAAALSADAKALEMAAKEDHLEYIKENHTKVMEEYRDFLHSLEQVFAGPQEQDGQETGAEPANQEKATILVVDDDLMNIKLAQTLFQEEYFIISARSGAEVFKLLEQQIPNLILLDVHMPEMNGHEIIQKLKADERYENIPVIFLTADNDGEAEVQGFHEGAMDFITKPFRKDIALQRIRRTMQLDYLQKYLQQEVAKQTRTAEERRESVERISLQMVQTLANTIDAKDKYTNGHSTRVAKYSVMLAKKMGYKDEQLELLEYSALLHDIGKIGVPDEIINKTSKLNDEEYEKIKQHPVIGSNILKNITELPNIGVGARWHHERFDGRGYPDHLKGMEIPEVARIIGVADSYDAMTSKRSYRDVMPQDVVRGEIIRCKGTQFDPAIADIMVQLIDEDTEYKMHEV